MKRRESLSESKQGYIVAPAYRKVGIYQVGQSQPEFLFDFQIEHNCDWEEVSLFAVAQIRFATWGWCYEGLWRRDTDEVVSAARVINCLDGDSEAVTHFGKSDRQYHKDDILVTRVTLDESNIPSKSCVHCSAVLYATARHCPMCGNPTRV